MKHFLLTLLLAASSLFAFSQIKSATLTASGLTCSMCSKAIYKTLLKLPYVAAVDVDMDKSVYLIQFKPGSNANPDGLKTAVEKAGFFVASL
ncbi:MAG: copper chaperone, partial [Chitinophagia bacterium]|nr:copper chaperone [Chitinophagia bacterium]